MTIEERIAIAVGKLKEAVKGTYTHKDGLCRACDLPTVMMESIEDWPEKIGYGSLSYPIEGSGTIYYQNENKYDTDTKFGRRRIALAKWLIERFDT